MTDFFSKSDIAKCLCTEKDFKEAKDNGYRHSYSELGKTLYCYFYKGKYYYGSVVNEM